MTILLSSPSSLRLVVSWMSAVMVLLFLPFFSSAFAATTSTLFDENKQVFRLGGGAGTGGAGTSNDAVAGAARMVVDLNTGAAEIFLDDNGKYSDDEHKKPWFVLPGGMSVVGWSPEDPDNNNSSALYLKAASASETDHPLFGSYSQVSFTWAAAPDTTPKTIETSYWIFHEKQMVIFDQYFPYGWTPPPPATDDGERQSSVLPTIVAPFPSIQLKLPVVDDEENDSGICLGYLLWGECFLLDTRSGDWADLTSSDFGQLFTGDTYGQPWVVHDEQGRTVVWSSLSNFFVSGFAVDDANKTNGNETLHVGLRTTLTSIPSDFHHTSIMVAGNNGINATLMDWGDFLLEYGSGKDRANVYDDFMLAHLGYWTDNGAYHYRGAHEDTYANMEEALLAVKQGLIEDDDIPIRYMQWDDWWMESKGDIPGMLSWDAKPEVFPSGFSDWLGLPLAMYAPEYSGENVWINDYTWKTVQVPRGSTSIPLDPNFYMDLFRNGTKIGMVIFEQDFLCSYGIGDSGLTSTDVDSGSTWIRYMDEAAQKFGIKLQFCMPDAYHLLESTKVLSVTNARATEDNVRKYRSILSMGQNGLLYYALGVFASRDNVWTSNADVEQPGCGNMKETGFCYEANAHLDNAVAVLSGGPYGIADALGFTNKTLAMYSCRTDGLMLRPRWPLASLDFSFTLPEAKGSLVWAAHDDFGQYRWSYLLGVELDKEIPITPSRLIQGSIDDDSYPKTMVAWEVVVGKQVSEVTLFSESRPFLLPRSPPLNLPYDIKASSHTHFATAPVLPNGMVILGEYQKWATMSFGRVISVDATEGPVILKIKGAPSETTSFAYLQGVSTHFLKNNIGPVLTKGVRKVQCTFPPSCSSKLIDQHGNPFCHLWIVCQTSNGCECSNVESMNQLTEYK